MLSAILLPAGNASTWTGPTGNNTFLITGRIPALIDAGVGHREHIDAIARALDGRALALVLVTHGHSDHVAGLPALVERWPGVRIRRFGGGGEPLVDGERVDAGDSFLTVLHTPGHSPDHCCFMSRRDVFCGDLLRAGGTVVIPASRGGNLSDYLDSLRRLRELAPARLLPAHGPIVDRPDAAIDWYLQHRAERERQIVEALGAGLSAPEQIVSRVYAGLAEELVPAALESVLANLLKLRQEGRATERNGVWTGQAG
jgi:glyoxylase-like metal-dependent hydrolase (beta-lactamase superfamily II)